MAPPFFQRLDRRALAAVLAASVVVGASGSCIVAERVLLPAGETLPGLRLAGQALPEGDVASFVHVRVETLLATPVRVVLSPPSAGGTGGAGASDVVFAGTLRDVGVTVDEVAVVARARALGHTEDLLRRIELARLAKRGALDLPLLATTDGEKLRAILAAAKETRDVAPVSARLDVEHQGIIPEKMGRYIDSDAAVSALAQAVRADETAPAYELTLRQIEFPPRMTAAWVKSLDVHAELAAFETHFSRGGEQARRARNIEVGASKIDGLILSPGELVSFNDVVGERSEENGFQKAWEIFKGEMVEGVGGGTCQVASTLHAISFFGGLDILERLPHSRPSAYIPLGLDATVVYPAVDMKLRNPFPFPVAVHAKVEGTTLKMQLLGARKPAKVEFSREITKSIAYGRKVTEEPRLKGTDVVVKQHGIRGFHVKRTRTLHFDSGETRVEETNDIYPPTTEIYEVPTGFDESLLPPLPPDTDDDDDASPLPSAPAAPAAAVASKSDVKTAACTGDCATGGAESAVHILEGKGAHAPTKQQAHPPKTLTFEN